MGFPVGDTGAPDLSHNHRTQLLGRCTDLNAISWTLAIIRAHTADAAADIPAVAGPPHQVQGYSFSQLLTTMADIPVFPIQHSKRTPSFHGVAPAPYP